MKALRFTEYGSVDVLKIMDVEKPSPRDDQVLIKVHAVSMNDWDAGLSMGSPYFMRYFTGLLKPKKQFQRPGCDVAGEIEAVGKNIEHLKVGDEVFGDLCVSGFGSFAEYVCAPESALEAMSEQMTFVEAAAMPQAGQLAIQGIIDTGNLRSGQKLLLNGAGGGVGTLAVQMAKSIGAEVTAVDSADKLEMLRSLGADHVIDYKRQDFTASGKSYDLILDTKTGRSPSKYLRVLSENGMYATVGGSMPRVLQTLLLGWLVSFFSNKKLKMIGQAPNKDLATMKQMIEDGIAKPVIDKVYPFYQYREAYGRFLRAEQKGKVIMIMV